MFRLWRLRRRVQHLARRIEAPAHRLPAFGTSFDAATLLQHETWLIVDGKGYAYVINDSGRDLRTIRRAIVGDLLYHVFEDITFGMASDWEVSHRVAGKDQRRALFQRQEELMHRLDPAWAERLRSEHARVLAAHPFEDGGMPRAKDDESGSDQI